MINSNIENFYDNENFVIYIDNNDYNKINNIIYLLNLKYSNKLSNLRKIEENETFNLSNCLNKVSYQRKIIINIIKDVINYYVEELENLECVFLSGSYARGTNKMSSDLDLHFFYKNGNYNYVYEEIVCYIISRIIQKSRDCIDPTFILNLSENNKRKITNVMTDKKLSISLIAPKGKIKYSYNCKKKRRFFLQYNNSRNIIDLKNYISKKIKSENLEWCHTFLPIIGENIFYDMYMELYNLEKQIINKEYIKNRIDKLLTNMESLTDLNVELCKISKIKKTYQSDVFEIIYEYILIKRFNLLYLNEQIYYLNLIQIYNCMTGDTKNNIELIYKYMLSLKKLTVYCYKNSINYGLHNDQYIDYDLIELNTNWKELKCNIILDLKEVRKQYE